MVKNWEYACTYTWLDRKNKEKLCQVVVTEDERTRTGQDNFNHIYAYGVCAKHYKKVKDVYNNLGSDKCLGYNFAGLPPKNCKVRDRGEEENPPPDFMYGNTFKQGRCPNCQSERKNANISSWKNARVLKSGRGEPLAFQYLETCITCMRDFEPESSGVNGPCLKDPKSVGCQAYMCRTCLFGGGPNQGLRKNGHPNRKPKDWCPLCNRF